MYRRPAVTVIQEFAGLVPALAAFNLPCVCVGPAYQLVTNSLAGAYTGISTDYPYVGLIPGAQVDLEVTASDEQFKATKKQIEVSLSNAEIKIMESITGEGIADSFSDAGLDAFIDVLAGDYIVISPSLGVSIIGAQIDGVSDDTPGMRDRLTAGVPGQFQNVKVGDTVTITGGTNTNVGTYIVLVKVNSDLLKLDADINTGAGPSIDVAYSIVGDRGIANEGQFRVKTVVDVNNLELESPLIENEFPLTYYVKRKVPSIALVRDTQFSVTETEVTVNAGIDYEGFEILSGDVKLSYRALRNDLAAAVITYERLTDLQSAFGIDQITPQNPLAYALSIMLQNTTTPVNGLGLNEDAVTDEVLSYQYACDVLAQTEMYAIVPLTQNPAIHQVLKTHVEGLSQPENKKERIALVNRLLITEELVQQASTTSTEIVGARVMVSTQLDGSALLINADELNDATSNQFLNVAAGDTLTIVGGTNAIVGTYTVVSKTNSNKIVLDNPIVTADTTDIQYYISRKDGLESDGITFYDRNTSFIADGVSAGFYIRFISGPLTGVARISRVLNDKKLEIDQIPGITTLQSGVEYEIYRLLSKTEQAEAIAGYSHALASRRVYNIWPDVVHAPVGSTVVPLPGYYAACAPAAMVTGLPTQQGFTNLSISGFLGLEHSSRYFTDVQLDIMADGGTFILAQDGEAQPLYVRHQLSSDRSSIKFQELSVTKNVDYLAKFIRRTYAPFIGVYNIVNTTLDELKSVARSLITFFKDDTRLPKIGGVIRSGQLTLLEEHPTQIDTVRMRFKLDIPIPLNNLDITIEV